MSNYKTLPATKIGVIVAGLRLLQEHIVADRVPEDIDEIATYGRPEGRSMIQRAAEIDMLCQWLNVGGPDLPTEED